jgi:hypothetical protein
MAGGEQEGVVRGERDCAHVRAVPRSKHVARALQRGLLRRAARHARGHEVVRLHGVVGERQRERGEGGAAGRGCERKRKRLCFQRQRGEESELIRGHGRVGIGIGGRCGVGIGVGVARSAGGGVAGGGGERGGFRVSLVALPLLAPLHAPPRLLRRVHLPQLHQPPRGRHRQHAGGAAGAGRKAQRGDAVRARPRERTHGGQQRSISARRQRALLIIHQRKHAQLRVRGAGDQPPLRSVHVQCPHLASMPHQRLAAVLRSQLPHAHVRVLAGAHQPPAALHECHVSDGVAVPL